MLEYCSMNQKRYVSDMIKYLEDGLEWAWSVGLHSRGHKMDNFYVFWAERQLRCLRQIHAAWEIIERKGLGEPYRSAIQIDVEQHLWDHCSEWCLISFQPAAAAAILIC